MVRPWFSFVFVLVLFLVLVKFWFGFSFGIPLGALASSGLHDVGGSEAELFSKRKPIVTLPLTLLSWSWF